MSATNITDPRKRKHVIVCGVCSRGPLDGVALFSVMVAGERIRHCAEPLPLLEIRRLLEAQRRPLLDPDVRETFARRLVEEAEQ